MRSIFGAIICILLFSGVRASAQDSLYHVTYDTEGNKVLTGRITEPLLANDPSFSWFYSRVNRYEPDTAMIRYISAYRDSFNVVVFAGTWGTDTKHLLPQFYRVMIASSYPLNRILLYGVGHDKKTLGDEAAKYRIINVPTIIVLYHGREVGRIVESVQKNIETDLVALIYRMTQMENKS
jgi:hypothetical protein